MRGFARPFAHRGPAECATRGHSPAVPRQLSEGCPDPAKIYLAADSGAERTLHAVRSCEVNRERQEVEDRRCCRVLVCDRHSAMERKAATSRSVEGRQHLLMWYKYIKIILIWWAGSV